MLTYATFTSGYCRESIFGYKDLSIQMYYTAAKLYTYLNVKYLDKVSPQKNDGLQVNTVVQVTVF